ncbi:MAG: sensor domain-containing diguanylate cyclase [Acholeplasmataceae bacterium]|jgi:diguanylate cyclase (GGDEF)-like protein|nr:sensor domain-containing diguanylate cyclase [Acholeplasmataceae bacterium]
MKIENAIKLNKQLIQGIRISILVLFVLAVLIPIVTGSFDQLSQSSSLEKVLAITGLFILFIATVWVQFDLLKGSLLGLLVILSFDIFHILNYETLSPNLITHLYMIATVAAISFHFFSKIISDKEHDLLALTKNYEHLERSHEITKAMMGVTPHMLLNDDLNKLLQNILEIAVDLVPNSESGSIIVKKDDNHMEFLAAVGYDLSLLKQINLRFEDTYQYRLQTFFEPTVISDLKTFNEANPDRNVNQEFIDRETVIAASVLTCGIMFEDQIYGFINLDNMENQDAFDEQDKLLIKHLASQIEIALNNHHLVEKIYRLSQYDSLTGIYSRDYYDKIIESYTSDSNVTFSFAMLDLNDLKKINDTYGHFVGDQYIVHFIKTIQYCLTSKDSIYRTGGDEFAIIMLDTKLHEGLKNIETIREHVNHTPFIIDEKPIIIDFGSGVAHYKDDHEDIQMVIRLADRRMYQDKKERK